MGTDVRERVPRIVLKDMIFTRGSTRLDGDQAATIAVERRFWLGLLSGFVVVYRRSLRKIRHKMMFRTVRRACCGAGPGAGCGQLRSNDLSK